ncbi:MAG: RNA polymerase sigma factor [Chloroflexi bacterium]|nr:RNA polymerase sigma factor [Chloroflexota bacterium]
MDTLLARCAAGDKDAFAALYDQYANLVYKTAVLALETQQDAEDALQEVFLKVYRGLHTYDPVRGAFTTWLYRVTLNHCMAKRRRRSVTVTPLDGQTLSTPPADRGLATIDQLRRVLNQLDDRQREVVILRYYWDLPYREIAAVLEIPLGTVQSRLSRALQTMKHIMEVQQ